MVHRRVIEPDGSLVEIKIWQVSKSSRQPHGFKYSLVYVVGEKRILGYDNAHDRDHRHLRDKDYPYRFVSPAGLIQDFLHDLSEIQEGRL
jgi:hypothetical protein